MSPDGDLPKERYLPLPAGEVVRGCAESLDPPEAERFCELADLLAAVLHAGYRRRWQRVKESYAACDAAACAEESFVDQLRGILDAANYEEVPRSELESALGRESVFRVRLEVDLDDFAELLLFRRGCRRRTETVGRWLGLRRDEVTFLDYRRVAMYARYRDREHFEACGIDVADLPFEPGRSFIKLFQDVPADDLEMLLPNTDVRMRTIDKLVIGVPAAVGGVVVGTTKLAAALGLLVLLVGAWLGLREDPGDLSVGRLVTLFGGLVAFGAFVWRQWNKFKNRRIRFMKALSENLYFKTVADGLGVLFAVLDAAEEEDLKEAVLAYRTLLDGPCSAAELDQSVEKRLETDHGIVLDFEVSDALRKLNDLDLAEPDGERCRAVPVPAGTQRLMEHWVAIGRDGG